MSEETLVQLCAPTLAGLKTGNLFAAEYHSPQEVRDQVRRLNRVLVPRGLRAMPMRYGKARALIYVYRPDRLQKDLMDEQAKSLLREQGYAVSARSTSGAGEVISTISRLCARSVR